MRTRTLIIMASMGLFTLASPVSAEQLHQSGGNEAPPSALRQKNGDIENKEENNQKLEHRGDKKDEKAMKSEDELRMNRQHQSEDRAMKKHRDARDGYNEGIENKNHEQSEQKTEGRYNEHSAVHLDEHKRDEIRERLGRTHEKRLPKADFSIHLGAVIPHGVELYELPPSIVDVVPEYREYRYVLVGDRLLIIDPRSHEIVDVIRI
jgi:hypothetical protein